MKYKCWCVFFAGLLIFACNNGNNTNDNGGIIEDSSSSDGYDLSSSASEPNTNASSSSDIVGNLQSSSSASVLHSSSSGGGVSSGLAESSSSGGSNDSSSPSGSSSSANASSSGGGMSSTGTANSSSARASSSSGGGATTSSSSRASSSSGSVSSSSATVAGSSGSLSNGTRFTPDMLGLTPGATIASVNLNWISDRNSSNSKTEVRLLNANGGLVKTFTGTVANATTGKSHHKATMTDLTPNTNYKYSVSNNGTDWSYEYNYKTPPSGSVFTFALVADPQVTTGNQDSNTDPKASPATTAQGWKDIVNKIATKEATFILCAGDQVDGGITYKEDEYKVFFAPEQLRNIPLAPVIGNHDLHTEHFNHFNMPNMPSSIQAYNMYTGKVGNYYYLYNNLLIVALNTGYLQKSDNTAAAVAEYKKTIEAAKTAHAGKYDWLIVQHHKSTTSISAHSADEDIGFLIENGLEKLFTDQGVDLVIAGHDHIHVRSHLMKWDASKGYSVRSTDNKGTVYLTLTTASGVKYYPPLFILKEGQENAGPFTEKYPVLVNGKRGASELRNAKAADTTTWPLSTAFFVKQSGYKMPNYTPNYTIFEVNGKTIKATTRTSEDKLIDEFTITPKGPR